MLGIESFSDEEILMYSHLEEWILTLSKNQKVYTFFRIDN